MKRGFAKRYARALVEVAAQAGTLQEVREGLSTFVELLRSTPELSAFFRNPAVLLKDKKQVLDALAERIGLGVLLKGFLAFILERGELSKLPLICRAYEELSDERLNRVKVIVTSAVPLDGGERRRLQERLVHVAGRTVYLEEKIDPSLLGGLKVQLKSTVYDGSIRAHLARIRAQLLQGQSSTSDTASLMR